MWPSRRRLTLSLHEGLAIDAANDAWSDGTAIPISQVYEPWRAVPDATIRHEEHEHEFGCALVRHGTRRTLRMIAGLLEALVS